jgi:hypothetical protein
MTNAAINQKLKLVVHYAAEVAGIPADAITLSPFHGDGRRLPIFMRNMFKQQLDGGMKVINERSRNYGNTSSTEVIERTFTPETIVNNFLVFGLIKTVTELAALTNEEVEVHVLGASVLGQYLVSNIRNIPDTIVEFEGFPSNWNFAGNKNFDPATQFNKKPAAKQPYAKKPYNKQAEKPVKVAKVFAEEKAETVQEAEVQAETVTDAVSVAKKVPAKKKAPAKKVEAPALNIAEEISDVVEAAAEAEAVVVKAPVKKAVAKKTTKKAVTAPSAESLTALQSKFAK